MLEAAKKDLQVCLGSVFFSASQQGYAGNLRDYKEILRGPYLIGAQEAPVFPFLGGSPY